MICYSQNGHYRRTVADNYVAQAGEVLFDHYPEVDALKEAFPHYDKETDNQRILAAISELERQQTPRRIREATLDIDGGQTWLTTLEASIKALRDQLEE